MKKPVYRIKSEHGQSIVELAISLVFIVMLLVGVVDFGRAFFTYIMLRDAAQEGASYGAIYPDDVGGIESRVWASLHSPLNLSNDAEHINVEVNLQGSACNGNGIQVNVVYDEFPITIPFYAVIGGAQHIPMRASVTDTILRPPCH